jgi:hypothetical protein
MTNCLFSFLSFYPIDMKRYKSFFHVDKSFFHVEHRFIPFVTKKQNKKQSLLYHTHVPNYTDIMMKTFYWKRNK